MASISMIKGGRRRESLAHPNTSTNKHTHTHAHRATHTLMHIDPHTHTKIGRAHV